MAGAAPMGNLIGTEQKQTSPPKEEDRLFFRIDMGHSLEMAHERASMRQGARTLWGYVSASQQQTKENILFESLLTFAPCDICTQ